MESALAQRLSETGRLSPGALLRATTLVRDSGEPLHRVLAQLGLVSEKDLTEIAADLCDVDILSGEELPRERVADSPLSPLFLKKYAVLPLGEEGENFAVAMPDPSDEEALEAICFVIDRPIKRYAAAASDIETALLAQYEELKPRAKSEVSTEPDHAQGRADAEKFRDLTSDAPIIALVNGWIARASDQSVSDIHLEPSENGLHVRFRIDGALVQIDEQPRAVIAAITSRIKIMSQLDIGEKRLAQDGRMSLPVRGRNVDIRVSIIPTVEGESVVMRLLDRGSVPLDFASLGIAGAELARFHSVLEAPHGIVLVTGPTGSGKTTTLYTSLLHLQTPALKILTVEDPVEFRLTGVMQSQVHPAIGMGFADLLRSFLRHDPDVILVGEIRDTETARIAVQAALTGHLVLSTLHTNDAVSAVTRLVDMGVEDYLIPSTLNGVLAQRLVRRLCSHCREAYTPAPEVAKRLGLEAQMDGGDLILYRPRGCTGCGGTGVRGRMAIYELLVMNEAMREQVLCSNSAVELHKAAIENGMRPMLQNGLAAALAGHTTLEEVLRVTREA